MRNFCSGGIVLDKEKSLNNKYQKIDAETVETPLEETKVKISISKN